MRTTFAGWCEQLSQSVVGPSIDHNDLHLGNVFHSSPGRFCFYDWGDSVVAHPFASMLVGLGSVRRQLGVSVDDPVVTRPRDAYLEVFTDLAPRRELLAEMRLACTVGKVARALVWQRTVGMEGAPADEASTPLDAFAALLSESWLDAWG
jgi:hypothetical protein